VLLGHGNTATTSVALVLAEVNRGGTPNPSANEMPKMREKECLEVETERAKVLILNCCI
jgi:hypothetical protein